MRGGAAGVKTERGGELLTLVAPLVYLGVAVAMVLTVCRNGVYPSGSNMMYHLYRGQTIYGAWSQGVLWPGLDWLWYNGVELLRWVSPLPAYWAAFGIWLAGGDLPTGFLIAIGLICFLDGMSWMLVGRWCRRPYVGALMGLIWFFIPFNLYMLFAVGDLGYAMAMVFLPVLICQSWLFVHRPKWTRLPWIALCFALITLCSLGCAWAVCLGLILFLFLLCAHRRCRWRAGVQILLAMISGIGLTGVWLCAAVLDGNGVTLAARTVEDVWAAFDPLACLRQEGSVPYLGLAALMLAIFGSFCARRAEAGVFRAGLLLLLCVCLPADGLPGSAHWICLAAPALCLVLFAFLSWSTLRRPLAALMCLLLVFDLFPAWALLRGTGSGELAGERLDELQAAALIDQAQDAQLQRLALLDDGALESTGPFLISAWNGSTAAAFGWEWETAQTAENIAQVNQAMADGCYLYVFDRCMELGCDGVLFALDALANGAGDLDALDAAARALGYELVAMQDAYVLYILPTQGSWGLVSGYPAIGIGSSASMMSLRFPALEEASSANLNDYTFEQLSQYQTVYLSGFTWDDREQAEQLLLRLSRAGVRVVIDAQSLPAGPSSFLGVACWEISFSNDLPALHTADGMLYTGLLSQDGAWETAFLEGLEDCLGWLEVDGLTLEAYGTVDNENLIFIGLNLPFFYASTGDETAGRLMGRLLNLSVSDLPERTLVDLEVTYSYGGVTVTSPADGVNTTLAYHKEFRSDGDISEENHLLVVQGGTTDVALDSPYLGLGLAVSVGSLLLAVGLCLEARRKEAGKY